MPGALNFDGIDDHVDIADQASHTLPNGDWTIAFRYRRDATTTLLKYLYSMGGWGSVNSLNIFIQGTSLNMRFRYDDGTVDTGDILSTNTYNDTDPHSVLISRSGTTITMYIDTNGTVDSGATVTNAGFVDVNSLAVVRFMQNNAGSFEHDAHLMDYGKWDYAFSAEERASYFSGYSGWFFTNSRVQYMPFDGLEDPVIDWEGGNTGTVTGAVAGDAFMNLIHPWDLDNRKEEMEVILTAAPAGGAAVGSLALTGVGI